jgi:glycosyltransferase involved in cell wall biosynthesis
MVLSHSGAFSDRLLAQRLVAGPQPFFSVCIPQYGRRPFLEIALASLFGQSSQNFEIVVSDDCSKDDSNAVIPGVLEASARPYRYYAQPKNLGYDGNIRFLLSVSLARYTLFLGNDDALTDAETLQTLQHALQELNYPQVAFANAQNFGTGVLARRAFRTGVIGSGPDTAVAVFRSFSFISGLIFDCEWAHRYETDRWDRSIFYQIYLSAKIIASGGAVASIDVPAIRQEIEIDGKPVHGVANKLESAGWSLAARHSGMDNVIRVTIDAVLPEVPAAERSAWARRIIGQVLSVSYPYWLVEYRWLGNWAAGVGLARGMWPPLYTDEIPALSTRDRLFLMTLYFGVTGVGLTVPTTVFRRWAPSVARRIRRGTQLARVAATPSAG